MAGKDFSFYNTRKYKIGISFSLPIFFYFFIVFFLPFGVDNYNPNHQYTFEFFLEIFFFFIPLLVFSLLNEFLLRPLLLKTPSFIGIIIWSIWLLFLLSSIMFITYNILGNWHNFNLASYLEFLIQVPVVLLFPLVGTFFYFKYRSLQSQIAHILTTKDNSIDAQQLIEFKGQGSRDQITLSMANFLFGKAQDNYVELYYIENEQLKKFLIRASISNLSESITNFSLTRCHRSYMVNLLHVTAIQGKNHEMTLTIDPFDSKVPVSKSYQVTTLESLKKIKNFG